MRRRSSISEVEPRDIFLHYQDTVPLGNYKTLTYLSFLLCDMWESIERGRSRRADVVGGIGPGVLRAGRARTRPDSSSFVADVPRGPSHASCPIISGVLVLYQFRAMPSIPPTSCGHALFLPLHPLLARGLRAGARRAGFSASTARLGSASLWQRATFL